MKTLAATLNISQKDLFIEEISKEEIRIEETIVAVEKNEVFNAGLVKIINLSSLPFAWFPVANFLPPLLIMLFTKEKSQIVKQIVSLQIFVAIISPIIFMIVAILKLGSPSVMITMILLVLSNVCIILKNAYEIDRKQVLYYKLNFSMI
ncbi:DUF4870 domain-containing protein [Chryseobacterium chendengshani]|uniref:DUF4870 domain-containing protein n=1 Tax=Chryseobacterium sp. LJ668 TaxID=2864040 RepID=UPI00215D741D|nr:DUF4870 domain-containing protein [Chryseobacterium sp. LJ668]